DRGLGALPHFVSLLSPLREGRPPDALRRTGARRAGVGGLPLRLHPRLAHAAGGPGGADGGVDRDPGPAGAAGRARAAGAVDVADVAVRLGDGRGGVLDAVPALPAVAGAT